ncbi:MAG: cytochrome C biogenesis protein [Xanthobacteraceae bacterium]|nr:cytochrome C biogenesis protein [Xanthobacteraceae bacterium]
MAALCIVGAMPIAARAQDVSAWAQDSHSAVRLLAGSRSGAVVLGGVAFRLQPGWKTYWRTPGDSGVPPRFDFSGSDNIEAVTVLWPAPRPFPDGAGGTSLGYKEQVVLPLRIALKAPDKPAVLRMAISYAVCDKLCVPVEAKAELPLSSVASTEDATLSAALDAVPKPANVGDPLPLTIRDVRRDGDRDVIVDVAAADAGDPHLFVEGPTPEWALPLPQRIAADAPGLQRFRFALDGLPPGVKPDGAALKFTLVGNGHGYEFNVNLP